MTTFADILDNALRRMRLGEAPDAIVASFPEYAGELRELLETAAIVSALPPSPLPTVEELHADRENFLLEIALLQVEPVSASAVNRLKMWMVHLQSQQFLDSLFKRKEQWKMSTIVVAVALLLTVIVESVGGVSAMTGDILPGSPVYPVKLIVEESVLFLTPDPEQRAEQHMLLARERCEEIRRLAIRGEVPNEDLQQRLEHHLNLALRYANQLNDGARLGILIRVREMVQQQQMAMIGLQAGSKEPVRLALRETTRILERTSAEVGVQLQKPELNRARNGTNRSLDAPIAPSVELPGQQHKEGTKAGATGDCGDCTPEGDEHQYGPQPEAPGPGEPGGNPTGDCGDCTPEGDERQYGPQPEAPGPGEPGGNPTGDCGDCTPEGDEHQYGPQPDQPVPGAQGDNDKPCDDCTPEGSAGQNQHQAPAQGSGDGRRP